MVAPGDSLWNIAQDTLGNGLKYADIKELNGLTSSILTINQELKLPCDEKKETITKAKEEAKQVGIKLSVLVNDNNNNPLKGVSVTIHSKIQTAKTDKNGIATFNEVEPGEHKVILAYNDYTGEQTLNVDDSQIEQILTLQVQMNSGFSSPAVIIVIGILCLIILFLVYFTFRKKIGVRNLRLD